MQHETNRINRSSVESVSVAIPAVIRTNGDGKDFVRFLNVEVLFHIFDVINEYFYYGCKST